MRHRPIGIGIQGLADTFILLGMPFDSPEVILQAQKCGYAIFCTLLICNMMRFFPGPAVKQGYF